MHVEFPIRYNTFYLVYAPRNWLSRIGAGFSVGVLQRVECVFDHRSLLSLRGSNPRRGIGQLLASTNMEVCEQWQQENQ